VVVVDRKRSWGRIINIASLQSVRAFPNGLPYGTSKGGVIQLTRSMAEAWSGTLRLNGLEKTANWFEDSASLTLS